MSTMESILRGSSVSWLLKGFRQGFFWICLGSLSEYFRVYTRMYVDLNLNEFQNTLMNVLCINVYNEEKLI